MAYVLGQMQPLRQIRFENQQASFVPTDSDGPAPMSILPSIGAVHCQIPTSCWRPDQKPLHDDADARISPVCSTISMSQSKPFTLDVRNLQYSGEVVVASRWRTDHAVPLPKEDTHFRLVILTPDSADVPNADQLLDRASPSSHRRL